MTIAHFNISERQSVLLYWCEFQMLPLSLVPFDGKSTKCAVVHEGNRLFFEKTPQPCLDLPQIKMARWPKTRGEVERYTGAESVCTIRQEGDLCLWYVQQVHL